MLLLPRLLFRDSACACRCVRLRRSFRAAVLIEKETVFRVNSLHTIPFFSSPLAVKAFYEEGCEGVGCNIAGNFDCRRCIFDNAAYETVSRDRLFPPAPARPVRVLPKRVLVVAASSLNTKSEGLQTRIQVNRLPRLTLESKHDIGSTRSSTSTHPFVQRLIVYCHHQSGSTEALVDCPCCVPITYKLRPQGSECVWPATPPPSPAPTTFEEFLERNGGTPRYLGGLVSVAAAGTPMVMIAATTALDVVTACLLLR